MSNNNEEQKKLVKLKSKMSNWYFTLIFHYPENFQTFFKYWTLLNAVYNEMFKDDEEWKRVCKLGKKYQKYWDTKLEKYAIELIKLECVGCGRGEAGPEPYVKTATLFLREKLLGDQSPECSEICRRNKRKLCLEVTVKKYNFVELEALLRIIYQVRCNLFHGDKLEYDGPQGVRNRKLINISNKSIELLLGHLMQEIDFIEIINSY